MDRRQKKTRDAIFKAFIDLLSKKHYNQVTVGEIIERADVGRATFYAHFETKDYLLNSENNLRLASNKAEELSIKKLTKNAPAVRQMFEDLEKERKENGSEEV